MLGNDVADSCSPPRGSARTLISNRMTVSLTRGKLLALGHTSATTGTRVVVINISHHKHCVKLQNSIPNLKKEKGLAEKGYPNK